MQGSLLALPNMVSTLLLARTLQHSAVIPTNGTGPDFVKFVIQRLILSFRFLIQFSSDLL
jgi:hypothetical protein